jgi:L-aspartate oxidase
VHAKDETGAEVQRTLVTRIRRDPAITVWEFGFAIDLAVDDAGCTGAYVLKDRRDLVLVRARNTILCTGGCGRLFRETTKPDIATGDGLAMAFRAGRGSATSSSSSSIRRPSTSRDPPVTSSPKPSAWEGHLVDDKGERFTFRYHPAGELAPATS